MNNLFIKPIIEVINLNEVDVIKTSNEAYVSWWEEDQPKDEPEVKEN